MIKKTRLKLTNIAMRFGENLVLDRVDFDLRPGEVHALVGENGAGKTTLMRILAGIYDGFAGDYFKDGAQIAPRSPADALALGIGMIHQELSVIPELSVAENLYLGNLPCTRGGLIDWRRMYSEAAARLAEIELTNVDVRAPLERYTLGVHQIIEILRVVNSGAEILIMDEPTSALSPHEIETLMGIIRRLRNAGRSVVYISHFIDEVLQIADRVTVLRDGRHVATRMVADTTASDMIELILGRAATNALPPAIEAANPHPLLRARGLRSDAFHDIDLTIRSGEILGLFGAIGAGHFAVAKALFGMYELDQGQVQIGDINLGSSFSSRRAISGGIAFATESRRSSLFLDVANYRNITLPHLRAIAGLRPDRSAEVAISRRVMVRTNVHPADPFLEVGKLSGGNQQKVVVARWLTVPPNVLIVSEPTRGMDVGAKMDVLAILRALRNEGMGILIVSSEPETVLAVADRALTMLRGRITGEISGHALNQENLMRQVAA
jgi:ribose transport system ATP-binding protein